MKSLEKKGRIQFIEPATVFHGIACAVYPEVSKGHTLVRPVFIASPILCNKYRTINQATS